MPDLLQTDQFLRALDPGPAAQFGWRSINDRGDGPAVLYHGTLLYDFDLRLIDELLRMPSRQPEYRKGRKHDAFVANLPVTGDSLRGALIETWVARERAPSWPQDRVRRLVAERYSRPEWNFQR